MPSMCRHSATNHEYNHEPGRVPALKELLVGGDTDTSKRTGSTGCTENK